MPGNMDLSNPSGAFATSGLSELRVSTKTIGEIRSEEEVDPSNYRPRWSGCSHHHRGREFPHRLTLDHSVVLTRALN